jgi:hypothetical protein
MSLLLVLSESAGDVIASLKIGRNNLLLGIKARGCPRHRQHGHEQEWSGSLSKSIQAVERRVVAKSYHLGQTVIGFLAGQIAPSHTQSQDTYGSSQGYTLLSSSTASIQIVAGQEATAVYSNSKTGALASA